MDNVYINSARLFRLGDKWLVQSDGQLTLEFDTKQAVIDHCNANGIEISSVGS